ncbi:MAG: hypothetical protein IPI64_13160 [Chloracidobacterium sp.]|nr:hypothetical protein [Chloracidobacterium sp.]
MENETRSDIISKVPQLTLVFWIIKILATTLGETGGDAVTMSWLGETTAEANGMGYLIGTAIFGSIFVLAVIVQIKAKAFHPFLYWFTIVATTTVGTTLADYCTRSLGIGYAGGSSILFTCVLASLLIWRLVMGTVSVDSVVSAKVEMFYWVTIMFSQTLGTALGDWVASEDGLNLGYLVSTEVFGGLLLVIVGLYFFTKASRTVLFWAAFILTRPLGAVVGDFLDKPVEAGGLELSRLSISILLLVLMTLGILIFRPKAADEIH